MEEFEKRWQAVSPLQRKFIAYLVLTHDQKEAASLAKVSLRTWWRWKKDEAFQALVLEAAGQQRGSGLALLLGDKLARIAEQVGTIVDQDVRALQGKEEIGLWKWAVELILRITTFAADTEKRPAVANYFAVVQQLKENKSVAALPANSTDGDFAPIEQRNGAGVSGSGSSESAEKPHPEG